MSKYSQTMHIPDHLGDPTHIFDLIMSGGAEGAPTQLSFHVLKDRYEPKGPSVDNPNSEVEGSETT